MFFNYLKIAFRNITRDKYYSMISFTGLTIGLSFFGLMLITMNHEFSYDSTYTDSERIYRTILVSSSNQVEDKNAQLPLPFSEVISSDIEGIEAISKVYAIPQQVVETHQKRGRMDDLVATDASFFKIFDLDLVAGNASTALENQMSIVLTKEIAQRFYGDEDPIGKTFEVEMYGLFTVTGVLDDLPKNSSFRFGGIMNASVERYLENFDGPDWFRAYYTSWNGRVAYTYVKLSDGANPEYISDQFESIASNYFPVSSATRTFFLQPIHDVHFHSSDIRANISELNGTPGNVQYVYIFAALAILILSIACINYMNLSSARSIKRTSEVGLRSVFGAGKGQLILQFLIQSILIASLCVLPSLVVLQLMFPYFETLTGIELSLTLGDLLTVGSYAIPSVLIIGAISGLYPAIVLSRFQLSQTVKQTVGSVQSSLFRKGLVIGQFALTYSIIVITLIAGRQLNFIFDKELGFTDEQVVVMEINDGRLRDFIPDLKQQVTNHPNVTGIAGMTRMISGYREPDIIEVTRDNMPDENLPFSFYGFDEDVLPVLDIELIQGRNFLSEGGETLNQTSVLINQSAAQILFENESPINQIISIDGEEENYEMTVVGVVKDFHYQSLHEPIGPLIIGYINNPFVGIDDFAIRLTGNQIPETIAAIEQIVGNFIELDEEAGLEYEFLNSMITDYYKTDAIYRSLFMIGAWTTIALSIFGLVGLTAFYAEMRTKEFGIRKVLGASLKDLVTIQSTLFLKLISIAIFIGIPASILTSQKWLQNFSYQPELGAGLYIVAALCTLCIAIIPIGIISFKTSMQSPIHQISSE